MSRKSKLPASHYDSYIPDSYVSASVAGPDDKDDSNGQGGTNIDNAVVFVAAKALAKTKIPKKSKATIEAKQVEILSDWQHSFMDIYRDFIRRKKYTVIIKQLIDLQYYNVLDVFIRQLYNDRGQIDCPQLNEPEVLEALADINKVYDAETWLDIYKKPAKMMYQNLSRQEIRDMCLKFEDEEDVSFLLRVSRTTAHTFCRTVYDILAIRGEVTESVCGIICVCAYFGFERLLKKFMKWDGLELEDCYLHDKNAVEYMSPSKKKLLLE